MFTIERLKTHIEESFVRLTNYYQITIDIATTKNFLTLTKGYPLPHHVQRIKKLGGNSLSLLICKCDDADLNDLKIIFKEKMITKTLVAVNKPITEMQNTIARLFWPVYFYKPKEEDINSCLNTGDIYHFVEKILVHSSVERAGNCEGDICAGVCAIIKNNEVLKIEADSDKVLGHCVLKAVSAVSKLKMEYLCTGMDAYVVNEPCYSCGMAFVHGRIKRVFFINFKGGGAFSEWKIYCNMRLNHRYNVYKIVMAE